MLQENDAGRAVVVIPVELPEKQSNLFLPSKGMPMQKVHDRTMERGEKKDGLEEGYRIKYHY